MSTHKASSILNKPLLRLTLSVCIVFVSVFSNYAFNSPTRYATAASQHGIAFTTKSVAAVSIAAGSGHTCMLTSSGGVKCWGDNKTTPVDVLGLTSGVTAIALGDFHTCALTSSGGVKCWGDNSYGQLGDGTTASKTTPIDVLGLSSGVTAIAAGLGYTCALTSSGGVKCWGYNIFGQLGDGTQADKTTPVDVLGLTSGVTAIALGGYHTCALTSSGGVKCWGDNRLSQLGDGTQANKTTPVDVLGLTSGVTAIALGVFHTCALTSSGGVKCWGDNETGQLGDGTQASKTTPVGVLGLTSGVTAIALGDTHTCALTSSGGVKCWGHNETGQLGDGSQANKTTPVDVTGLTSGVIAIALGGYHTCALTSSGGVKCWGKNGSGQLGDGTEANKTVPVNVVGLTSGVTAIALGGRHTCALTSGGGVKCWGSNYFGQLGDGTQADKTTPVDVIGLTSGITAIALGDGHTCALTGSGGVKCWGDYKNTPVDVIGLTTGVTAIAAGGGYTCALTSSGGVKCWGDNWAGQLGDGTQGSKTTPVDVIGLTSGVTAIALGGSHTCALTSSGRVKCWGYNVSGELGDGTQASKTTPVDVIGLTSGVTAIAPGGSHTCALTSGGGLKCWGDNYFGQLGDGTQVSKTTPIDVRGLTSGVTAIALGDAHTCALTSGGRVKCWGRNETGRLGDGSQANKTTPGDVLGLTSGVTAIALGDYHTCALTSSGGVKCWGDNQNGQLGDGTAWRTTPVAVFTSLNGIYMPLVNRSG